MRDFHCPCCAEWEQVVARLEVEIERLETQIRERAQADSEYLTWSLGGGMVEAVFAGAELQRRTGGT